jgi:hypothetical protein
MKKESDSQQKKTEWLTLTKKGEQYHEKQFHQPYRSTESFYEWLESFNLFNTGQALELADIGAGKGANIFYMANRAPKINFTGIELNPELVKAGNDTFRKLNQNNCNLVQGDLYSLGPEHLNKYDGIVSLQTLSWLPEERIPIRIMDGLNPDWIAITSLFYDGEVNFKIEVQDYTCPVAGQPYEEGFYNIYSIPLVKQLFSDLGYTDFRYVPFEIDIDLPKPETSGLTTYTEKLENGNRIQISGALLMSWYFIIAAKPSILTKVKFN